MVRCAEIRRTFARFLSDESGAAGFECLAASPLPFGVINPGTATAARQGARVAAAHPGDPPVCDGASLGARDAATTARITADMRRTLPRLTNGDVITFHAYRRPGTVGGPFVPEVSVTVRAHSFSFLTPILPDVTGAPAERGALAFAGPSASAFGEFMGPG